MNISLAQYGLTTTSNTKGPTLSRQRGLREYWGIYWKHSDPPPCI